LKQSIQIIAGKYRGKKLSFPPIANLRPTTNRIKETLFNWLMHDIHDANCLDAFAGSGSLGFEAFSRGASYVTFIEKDKLAFQNLIKISASFDTSILRVIHDETLKYLQLSLSKNITPFDIIFFDPPFSNSFPYDCLNILANDKVTNPNALLYVEYNENITLDPETWTKLKQKQAGQVIYTLYRKSVVAVS